MTNFVWGIGVPLTAVGISVHLVEIQFAKGFATASNQTGVSEIVSC